MAPIPRKEAVNIVRVFPDDSLNRITSWNTSMMAGASRSQGFSYDSFGNAKQVSGTNMATFSPGYSSGNNHMDASSFGCNPSPNAEGVDTSNAGYDLAGNVLCSGANNLNAQAYVYDAESRVSQFQKQNFSNTYTATASYSYDAGGNRIRKDNGGFNSPQYTEYVYANGQLLTQNDQTGAWTDYVYANGKKIAVSAPSSKAIHIGGTFSALPASAWFEQVLGNTVTVANGDHLYLQQLNGPGACGGVNMQFSNPGQSPSSQIAFTVSDSYGYSHVDSSQSGWHTRSFDLSGFENMQISNWWVDSTGCSQTGNWDIYFADVAVVRADGTVVPLYNQSAGAPLSSESSNDENYGYISNLVIETVAPPATSAGVLGVTTHYFLSDHLGTTQMEMGGAAAGWPVWKGEFSPFGQELDTQATTNNYKFTGKERDTESGLDYFGARYLSSSMGRFMSPDSGADATVGVPVPFADLENPQSLNLYSYVLNNPVRNVDSDGHNVTVCANGSSQCYDLTDDQWKAIQKQIAAGNSGGVTVSGQGFMGTGTINCGGSACGTATYHEQGLIDESGSQLAGIALGMGIGKAVGAAWGAVAGWLGRGTGEAAGAAAETAASTGKVLLNAGTKQEAKAVVEAMADGAQKQAAKRALARAGSNASVSISESDGGLIRVEVTRPGFDGTQTITKAIDSAGNTTTVQAAHDASGTLVHYDPK